MEKTISNSADVPTALPGFEEDDAREQLLLESSSDQLENTAEEELDDADERGVKPDKRRWRILKIFAAFAILLFVLVVGITWFFGMGWFTKPQAQAVNRSGQKGAGTSAPATDDEKLKMALGMIAPASSPAVAPRSDGSSIPVDIGRTAIPTDKEPIDAIPSQITTGRDATTSVGEKESYSSRLADKGAASDSLQASVPKAIPAGSGTQSVSRSKVSDSDDARGRSLFFGITKQDTLVREEKRNDPRTETPKPPSPISTIPAEIPFGSMLPVRLLGSIYTLRNSGGLVRMELTRAVEGKGYSYPAGTMILGEVRGGEAVRAFVNVIGLIDPLSGELVKFSGELLGRDGTSGIEGKRRNLTSPWSRFFRGIKDTASSVLGSVGAFRSGGTVILSEPLRRSSESMMEDLSGTFLKNDRDNTFLEVAAGSNGYVLVTGLPEKSGSPVSKSIPDGTKE